VQADFVIDLLDELRHTLLQFLYAVIGTGIDFFLLQRLPEALALHGPPEPTKPTHT